jgi:vitamin B12 transporter
MDPSTFTRRVKLDGYTLVNLAASYDLTKNFQIFGRVENLLDKEYEEVKGYGTPGISFFGGIKLSF